MSGILTFGVEWETKLLVVNMKITDKTDTDFSEKVPYVLANRNTNPKNKYSLEQYHPQRNSERAENENVYSPHCLYSLEFIFGVFNNIDEFRAAITEFTGVINQALCTSDVPMLQITDSQNQIHNHYIVSIMDFPTSGNLENVYTDCSLRTPRHVGGLPPPDNVGVYLANQCPIKGNPQITIGVDLRSTGRLFSYLIYQPIYTSDTPFGRKQNFRDSSFKMASHFLFNIMGATGDLDVNIVCLEMIYVIMNKYRIEAFDTGRIEYFKMLLPIKPRTNLTCLISQLSDDQQELFYQWYEYNAHFLSLYFPKVSGYVFGQDYPEHNISKTFIYSADIGSNIPGVTDIAIVGNKITFKTQLGGGSSAKTMNVIHQQFLVWYGKMPELVAVLSPDKTNILLQGVGNPAFTSTDVNEWCTHPFERSTYNILEVRNISMYLGENRNVVSVLLEDLENTVVTCLKELQRIFTQGGDLNLQLTSEQYDAYYTQYHNQEAAHAKHKIGDVMDRAIADYMVEHTQQDVQEGLEEPDLFADFEIEDYENLLDNSAIMDLEN